jgi:hypothetical protein
MDRDPYAAPKSNVRDVSPETARHWIRTKWFYLSLVAPLAYALLVLWEVFQSATAATLAAGVGLAVLMTVSPAQALLARRSGSSPWWWDALFCCLLGTALAGRFIDDPILIVIGLIPFYVLVGTLVVLTWAIEARHCLRIYSKARGVVFVEGGDGL